MPLTGTCGMAGMPLQSSMFGLSNLFCQRREVTADVLVFRSTTPPSGAIKPTTITMEPGRGALLGISFFESQLDVAGEQWRSSAWTAITNSSLLLGEDLNQYSFAFDAEGNIDGPSAGGLFTSSTLALILGDSLKSEVTMTGTINPDGSIGPVGGIPLKVQAAHEQSKRRVVIPAGQLTPQLRDLETELGIKVQEAADVYQAYELLTGKPLPLPMGFADVSPQMSTAGVQAIQALIEDIHAQYQSERSAFTVASIPADLKPIDQAARDSFTTSRRAVDQGNLPSAYSIGRTALVQMRLVQNLVNTQTALAEFDDRPWDVSVLTKNWHPLIQETESLLQSLETAEIKTPNDAITASRAFGHLIVIIGLSELAQKEVEVLKTTEAARDPESEAYRRALFYLAIAPTLAAQQLNEAQDALQLRGISAGLPLEKRELAGFINTLNTASVAGVKAFESLTIQPLAASGAGAFELVAEDFKSKDVNYFLALAVLDARDRVVEAMENKENAGLARLGASQMSYLLSSVLISQYYSLGASFDPKLEPFGIRSAVEFDNPRALINMLDLAEVSARGNIAMAQTAGNDLTQQILMYEQAKFLREGTPADKISGLTKFWNASLEARLMTILAGEFRLERRPFRHFWLAPAIAGGLIAAAVLLGWRFRDRFSPIPPPNGPDNNKA
ncbi:S16 family serine protease [Leptolyngbya sp. KIOST-1]|uniref:S16 family serine protease n=1 Tax=Leptolyngbya sp. KIOST-1 TaxID=1229172 RepID=UPI0018CF6802|nr:S16 family serine protease [Leptolyngbya sp. KIOST-1]